MKVLSLDPSMKATGWALYDDGLVCAAGFESFDNYVDAAEWLKQMVYCTKPSMIVMEDFFFSKGFAAGSNVNVELRGIFKLIAEFFQIGMSVVGYSQWLKPLAGRIKPTADEIKRFKKEKAKKMVTVEALKKRGLECPIKIINPKSNRVIDFKYDISDALGILIYYLEANGLEYKYDERLWNFEIVNTEDQQEAPSEE